MISELIIVSSVLLNIALLMWIGYLKDDKDELHRRLTSGFLKEEDMAGWHVIEKVKIMNTLKKMLKVRR